MHAHAHQAGQTAVMGDYAIKRITRIFPAYWPLGVGLILLYTLMPEVSAAGGRSYGWFTSVTLLPSALPPALSVAWTLVHELMFYVIFMLYFVSRIVFLVGIFIWLALIAAAYENPWLLEGALRYPLSILNLEFLFGVGLCCILWKSITCVRPLLERLSGCRVPIC